MCLFCYSYFVDGEKVFSCIVNSSKTAAVLIFLSEVVECTLLWVSVQFCNCTSVRYSHCSALKLDDDKIVITNKELNEKKKEVILVL